MFECGFFFVLPLTTHHTFLAKTKTAAGAHRKNGASLNELRVEGGCPFGSALYHMSTHRPGATELSSALTIGMPHQHAASHTVQLKYAGLDYGRIGFQRRDNSLRKCTDRCSFGERTTLVCRVGVGWGIQN